MTIIEKTKMKSDTEKIWKNEKKIPTPKPQNIATYMFVSNTKLQIFGSDQSYPTFFPTRLFQLNLYKTFSCALKYITPPNSNDLNPCKTFLKNRKFPGKNVVGVLQGKRPPKLDWSRPLQKSPF